jgi:oligoribonuclease
MSHPEQDGRRRERVIVAIDLETTGLDWDHCGICELGVLVTDPRPPFAIRGQLWRTIMPTRPWRDVGQVGREPAIWEADTMRMHTESGLVDALTDPYTEHGRAILRGVDQDGEPELSYWRGPVGLHEARADLWRLLAAFQPRELAMFGSNTHFDRRFLERDMPEIADALTYWSFDVGQLRRTLRTCGLGRLVSECPDMTGHGEGQEVAHRAMDDVRAELAEFAYYARQMAALVDLPARP